MWRFTSVAAVAAVLTGLLPRATAGDTMSRMAPILVLLVSLTLMAELADDSTDRLLALLLGTNVGPLVLLWGSLATLLWRERCRARGLEVSAKDFAVLGLVGVPVLLVGSTAALALAA